MTMTLAPLLLRGDCLEKLKRIPDESVAAIVTDPPYGLSNTDPAHVVEALTHWANGDRSFIPSGRGFMGKEWDAFVPPPAVWDECMRILKPGGHLLAFAGSRTFDLMTLSIRFAGFDIRDSIAWLYGSGFPKSMDVGKKLPEWQGWGTALKPAFEPIVVARKPFAGTVAVNVLEHGTGALNIDATRIGYRDAADMDQARVPQPSFGTKAEGAGTFNFRAGEGRNGEAFDPSKGRWPANVILDEGQAAALDASRFFYVAKAPKSERPVVDGTAHPTVKPLALMRWLIRLVCPPGECVVDPFAGSGTTLEAAYLEGMESIGIELTPSYWPLIDERIRRVTA